MIIKWTGPEREVPRMGLLKTGIIKNLPDDLAKSFINQKLAVKYKVKTAKTEEAE